MLNPEGPASELAVMTVTELAVAQAVVAPSPTLASAIVVLPTYNEAGNIGAILNALLAVDERIDVVVVDDSSPDGTAAIADAVAGEHPGRVHVLRRPAKSGLGSAYRSGFTWATRQGYELIVQMDADGSHPTDRLPAMLDLAETRVADLVVGSRYIPGGRTEGWPLHRRLLSRAANTYARSVLGLALHDPTGGFKVWRAAALSVADPIATTTDGYGFQVELAVAAERRGLRVIETPITFTDRTIGESKMTSGIAVEAVRKLWALRRRGLRLRPGAPALSVATPGLGAVPRIHSSWVGPEAEKGGPRG